MTSKNELGTDWIQVITIAVIVTCVLVAVQYYYNTQVKICINDPLVYAANMYEDMYGYPFRGSGYFVMEGSNTITITFDKNNSEILDFSKL